MTITIYGVDPSIDEAAWARLMRTLGRGAWMESVYPSGGQLAATIAVGTRTITIADGAVQACGVLLENSAPVNVVHDANNGTQPRIDTIVAQFNWAGSSSTGGSIIAVKGSPAANPTAPVLTASRVAGTLWQVPLCDVLVSPGVGTFPGGVVSPRQPGPRRVIRYTGTVAASDRTAAAAASEATLATIDIPDPGWPYHLEVIGAALMSATDNGQGVMNLRIDGSLLENTRSMNNGGEVLAVQAYSVLRTGKCQATLTVSQQNMTAPARLTFAGTFARFQAIVHPSS